MDPEEILLFWFGENPDDPECVAERCKLWFGRSPAFDALIRMRFGGYPRLAAEGCFESWQETPRFSLALVLVLDQFPRNLFRGTAESFAFDSFAVNVAKAAIDSGYDRQVRPVEAAFFYLPLEHAEDPDLQRQSVECFRRLIKHSPRSMYKVLKGFEDYAERHFAVIARFGRFPHRNRILGRSSTEEERAYLAAGGETFGGGFRHNHKKND